MLLFLVNNYLAVWYSIFRVLCGEVGFWCGQHIRKDSPELLSLFDEENNLARNRPKSSVDYFWVAASEETNKIQPSTCSAE